MFDRSLLPPDVHRHYPQRADGDRRPSRAQVWVRSRGLERACRARSLRQSRGPADIRSEAKRLRRGLSVDGLNSENAVEALCLTSTVAQRSLGVEISETQRSAAMAMLHGAIVEFAPGEGKTLTVAVAAGALALARLPVHIVTARESLALRDTERMRPFFEALGVTVSNVTTASDVDTRRRAYCDDVVYGSAREFILDHLRDGMVMGSRSSERHLQFAEIYGRRNYLDRLFLRGLGVAILDDADKTLLDDAVSPFVVTAAPKQELDPASIQARLSAQRFFRRYLHIAGITSTASEAAHEFRKLYGCPVFELPSSRSSKRHCSGCSVLPDPTRQQENIVARVQELQRSGRPVLVVVGSEAEAEDISCRLTEGGVAHRLTGSEAETSGAQQAGQTTIIESSKSYGLDIRPGPATIELGGLHILICKQPDSDREDRRLQGLCGRRGEPGSYEYILSLADPLLEEEAQGVLGRMVHRDRGSTKRVRRVLRRVQQRQQEQAARRRADLLRLESDIRDRLAFAGLAE